AEVEAGRGHTTGRSLSGLSSPSTAHGPAGTASVQAADLGAGATRGEAESEGGSLARSEGIGGGPDEAELGTAFADRPAQSSRATVGEGELAIGGRADGDLPEGQGRGADSARGLRVGWSDRV